MTKTKIVATIGPACESPEKIKQLIKAGVDVFRFNMKHNTQEWHSKKMGVVRRIAKELGRPVAILMDLQGPEVRIGELEEKIRLSRGEEIFFGQTTDKKTKTVLVDNLKLLHGLPIGEKVFIDDGRLELRVVGHQEEGIRVKVLKGGILSSRKGVNFSSIEVSIPTLFEKDLENLSLGAKEDVDFVALSFVRDRKDILKLKKVMKEKGLKAGIIAKIETEKSLLNFDEILKETDGVMVARGDLGVELPLEQVPFWQKKIITLCRESGKPVITATEMLQSMTESSRPTRAEVSDVANAVYDGTDALMLSAETATGEYPVESVKMMEKIAVFLEGKKAVRKKIRFSVSGQAGAIVNAAYNFAKTDFENNSLKGFVVLTETGRTARLLACLRPKLPIFAVTPYGGVRDQLCLSWGVRPHVFDFSKRSDSSVGRILKFLKQKENLKSKDLMVMIYGRVWGEPGMAGVIRLEPVE